MNKKYTMKEFKQMYDKAMHETIKKLSESNTKANDPMLESLFGMLNVSVLTEMRSILFNEEGDK